MEEWASCFWHAWETLARFDKGCAKVQQEALYMPDIMRVPAAAQTWGDGGCGGVDGMVTDTTGALQEYVQLGLTLDDMSGGTFSSPGACLRLGVYIYPSASA